MLKISLAIINFYKKEDIYFLIKRMINFKKLLGMGIGDWELGIGDWAQSPIPNPQSPIPN